MLTSYFRVGRELHHTTRGNSCSSASSYDYISTNVKHWQLYIAALHQQKTQISLTFQGFSSNIYRLVACGHFRELSTDHGPFWPREIVENASLSK